jgi:two-component system cell cycle sensor histidine kinase/response regulator CckA
VSTVRAIVEACGGRIVFESELGRGTEVRIILPEVTPLADEVAQKATTNLFGRRVLLVEDDDTIRRAFARGLSALGASVIEAASIAGAAAAIAEAGPGFDVMVCDGILGDGTVDDLLTAFRNRCGGSPVLLCTGHGPEVFAARGVALAGITTVAKPITGLQLARAAAQTLHESQNLRLGGPSPHSREDKTATAGD